MSPVFLSGLWTVPHWSWSLKNVHHTTEQVLTQYREVPVFGAAAWGWQCCQNIKKNWLPWWRFVYRALDQHWSADCALMCLDSECVLWVRTVWDLSAKENRPSDNKRRTPGSRPVKNRGARLLGTERSTILGSPEEKWPAASFPVCSRSLSWIHLWVNTHLINSFLLDLRLVLTSFFHVDPVKMDLLQAAADQCFLFKSLWIKKSKNDELVLVAPASEGVCCSGWERLPGSFLAESPLTFLKN